MKILQQLFYVLISDVKEEEFPIVVQKVQNAHFDQ